MSLYQRCLDSIEKDAINKREGRWNGIPYPYKRMRQFEPSIDKEKVIAITSFTGAGKSKFTRYTFVLYPYEFALHNNYPLLIDYYALEDSAEKVFKNILCNYVYMKHGLHVSYLDLQSKFKELSSEVRLRIKEGEKYLQDFSNKVRIKDNFTNPIDIHKDIIKTARTLGEIETETYLDSNKMERHRIIGFKPKDDTHWMATLDNLNNLDSDYYKNDKEAMDNFVKKNVRLIYSKIFKMTWSIIHQQALEAERQQFTSAGGSILEKIKPSLANLGGTKEVVRSYHLVYSLFNPHKFKIPNYEGYDIGLLGNNFRELEIIKNNDGAFDNLRVPLFFDGGSEYLNELPRSKDEEELKKFYSWLQNERLKRKTNNLLF